MENIEKEFVYGLKDSKLEGIYLAANMLRFCFDNSLHLHVNGFCRVIKNSDLLITTHDYDSWDGEESTHNDEWVNVKAYKDELIGGKVTAVELNPINDLKVTLDNGVTIECLIENAYPHYEDEMEQWVLFEGKESGKEERGFLTVYNKRVKFTPNFGIGN